MFVAGIHVCTPIWMPDNYIRAWQYCNVLWTTTQMAATFSGNGRWLNRPYLDFGRNLGLSGAALAPERWGIGCVSWPDLRSFRLPPGRKMVVRNSIWPPNSVIRVVSGQNINFWWPFWTDSTPYNPSWFTRTHLGHDRAFLKHHICGQLVRGEYRRCFDGP